MEKLSINQKCPEEIKEIIEIISDQRGYERQTEIDDVIL